MKFTLDNKIFELVPNAKVGVLVAKNIDNGKNGDATYQNLWEEIEELAKSLVNKNTDALPEISSWNDAFKKAGMNPKETLASHTALITRVSERQGIPNINPLVNILNTISLRHKVPIGGHDLDNISGNITVGPNRKELTFTQSGKEKPEDVDADEIVYADEESILTRKWVWRQVSKTMTTESTENVFIPIDTVEESTTEALEEIAKEIAALISATSKTSSTKYFFKIATAKEPTLELDDLPELIGIKKLKVMAYPIKRDEALIERLTTRAVEKIYPSAEVLREWLVSGRRLNIYQGFDPTGDSLHIGHTVGMRKLRDFQKLGHKVTFMIGDFTARVGDPTDKTASRKKLSKAEVERNMRAFKEQASSILDFDDPHNPVQVLYNSSWLDELKFADILELSAEFTVQQMIKRDMFQKRLEIDKPIHINEFMYPLMQGYDSQHMNIDVEVGGNDQTFNMLAGRQLTASWLNKEKIVVSCKLLVDPGGKKMGKTEGNMVMLADSPEDMFGKIMAFPDELIIPGFEILTDTPETKMKEMAKDLESDQINPMDLKKQLAFSITKEHKGEKAAQTARKHFEDVYQNRLSNGVESIPEIAIGKDTVSIIELLTEHTGFAESNSQAKRLVTQGAISVDGEKIGDKAASISLSPDGSTLRAGRHVALIKK